MEDNLMILPSVGHGLPYQFYYLYGDCCSIPVCVLNSDKTFSKVRSHYKNNLRARGVRVYDAI